MKTKSHNFMPIYSQIHNRQSIRLKGYNYSSAGDYFVTICTQNRNQIFGCIYDDEMLLNDVGMMVDSWWKKLTEKYSSIILDECVIMPNHLYGIISITNSVGADPCVCPSLGEHTGSQYRGEHTGSPLHRMLQWFKTMTTNEYIRRVRNDNWLVFDRRLWQRNYFERIIRNEKELMTIRNYIKSNPMNWINDENYF